MTNGVAHLGPHMIAWRQHGLETGVTQVWEVRAGDAAQLGMVRWHSPWRRYLFQPADDTGFDCACLRDIALFCEALTTCHKADRALAKQGTQAGQRPVLQEAGRG